MKWAQVKSLMQGTSRGSSAVLWLIVRRSVALALILALVSFVADRWNLTKAASEVEMQVKSVAFDHGANSPVILLQKNGQGKVLPIWIGHFEARAIAMELEGISGPRPLTHDLMKRIVEELDGQVERVVIDDLRDHTYYASIHLISGGDELQIDSRPSDAIALALRFRRPILVNGDLLAREGVIDAREQQVSDVRRLWGLTLQDVTPGLAQFFALAKAEGVLVSDVGPGAAAGGVERGDIITDVHGRAVMRLADLEAGVMQLEDGERVQLGIMRKGAEIRVSFTPDEP